MRRFILGIGQIGLEIGALFSGGHGGDLGAESAPDPDSPPARTWYGRILQWTWALLILLAGLACLAIALLVAAAWVMSWFS